MCTAEGKGGAPHREGWRSISFPAAFWPPSSTSGTADTLEVGGAECASPCCGSLSFSQDSSSCICSNTPQLQTAIITCSSPDRLGTRCHTILIVFLGPLSELLKRRDHALPNSTFPLRSWHLVPISCSLNLCQMLNGWLFCGRSQVRGVPGALDGN